MIEQSYGNSHYQTSGPKSPEIIRLPDGAKIIFRFDPSDHRRQTAEYIPTTRPLLPKAA